jgi:SAM-dependent methyltransferase
MPFRWTLVEDWDPFAEVPWARAFLRRLSPRYRLASEVLLRTISDLVREEVRWLDVGAGENWLVHHYEEGSDGLGVGSDVYRPERIRRRERYVLALGERLPFRDGEFDLVTAHWVVEHLKEPEAFLREMHRVLRPGGRLFIRTPNLFSPVTALARFLPEGIKRALVPRVFLGGKSDYFEAHYPMNTEAKLREMPKRLGFRVESMELVEDLHFRNRLVFFLMFLLERLSSIRPLRILRSQVFAVYCKS